MLLAASVYTTQNERLRARWKLEGGLPPVPGQKVTTSLTSGAAQQPTVPLTWLKEEYRFCAPEDLGPTMVGESDYSGIFVAYDWDRRAIVWQSDWGNLLGNPAGYCFADGVIYMNDFEAGNIFRIQVEPTPGKLLQRISHPYFNDLHSLERTKRGLLAACSGTDLVVEVDLTGKILWEWWAAEHGYTVTPSGETRPIGRGNEHRNRYYHTRYQATHVNCATVRDPGSERFILCLLFHQGVLIEIDRSLGPEEQSGKVILEGLARPHSLEKIPGGGWIFCNSLSKELVLLDDDLKITGNIPYDGGWIQDCTRLPNGNIVLNDVDNTVLIEFAPPDWKIVSRTEYCGTWRMGELVVVPPEHEHAFLQAQRS
ncbi:MAG TPA: hypothetical protein VFW25_07050 [Silvibacterium sp.]|nr:hypothetical protein [Silvibacterium sp.]